MKKAIVNIASLALAAFAFLSCAAGCMEFLQEKSYFGLGETTCLVFALLFSLLVFAFTFKGFQDFLFGLSNNDKKK